jgi:hypothetical protein
MRPELKGAAVFRHAPHDVFWRSSLDRRLDFQPAQLAVGYLLDSGSEARSRVAPFRDGLAEDGYVEGQNVRSSFVSFDDLVGAGKQ